jgi:diguanylate cyclase (GGDEF)-like protein
MTRPSHHVERPCHGSATLKWCWEAVDTPGVEAPPLPKNDLARVGSLRRLGILDTGPEERFDRITRIARRLFGVDTALMSLVDIDRQWTKSRQGPATPGIAEARQAFASTDLPRELSFCAHAIVGVDVLQVHDASTDDRFCDSPWVTADPPIRFYAGCPIASPDGAVIGTLCLLDRRPRSLDEVELASLRDLATVIEQEIAASRLVVDDELTGLANRKGFTMVGSQALAFCERQEVDALVIVGSADGLDLAYERGGTAAGDQLLRLAAAAMADSFRSSDVVGRVGGNRFGALLTGYQGSEVQVVERLRSTVAASNLELERTTFALSMTVGTARFNHREPETLEVLMHRAATSPPAEWRDRGRAARAEGA